VTTEGRNTTSARRGTQTLPPTQGGRRELLSTRVAELIERHIAREQLLPGDRLPSGRHLADMFSVSRTVVRDALSSLEQRGLIQLRPGSGVYVANGGSEAVGAVLSLMLRRDAVSFEELAEVRELLEIHSAGVAASRADPAKITQMRNILTTMKDARQAITFVEADIAFHEALAEASQNRVLVAFLESLRPLLMQGMLAGTRLEGAREIAIAQHTHLLDAISSNDEALARRLMTEHLRRSYREWHQAELSGAIG
jgi:GntR family transcriptional regulator, transcriptional repressor for pyruvate dehydrogenase complex